MISKYLEKIQEKKDDKTKITPAKVATGAAVAYGAYAGYRAGKYISHKIKRVRAEKACYDIPKEKRAECIRLFMKKEWED